MSIISMRTVTINEIPDECNHKARLLGIVQNPSQATVNVVVVKGMMGTIAYMGYPALDEVRPELRSGEILYDCQIIHTPKQVAHGGYKLEVVAARKLFPDIQNWGRA